MIPIDPCTCYTMCGPEIACRSARRLQDALLVVKNRCKLLSGEPHFFLRASGDVRD